MLLDVLITRVMFTPFILYDVRGKQMQTVRAVACAARLMDSRLRQNVTIMFQCVAGVKQKRRFDEYLPLRIPRVHFRCVYAPTVPLRTVNITIIHVRYTIIILSMCASAERHGLPAII